MADRLDRCPWCGQPLTIRIGAPTLTRIRLTCVPCLVVWSKHVDTRIGGITAWRWRVLGYVWTGAVDERPEPFMLDKAREYVTNKHAWLASREED